MLKRTLDIHIAPVKKTSAVDPIGLSFPDPSRVSRMALHQYLSRTTGDETERLSQFLAFTYRKEYQKIQMP